MYGPFNGENDQPVEFLLPYFQSKPMLIQMNHTAHAPLIGDSAEYYCNPSTGEFEGPAVTCTKISCNVDQLPSGFDSSGCSNLVAGDFCLVSCQQGFIPAEEKYTCGVDGNFSGTPPQCERVICPADTLPVAPGVNVSGCIGTVSGASCEVACELGYQGSASTYSCGLDGAFTGTAPVCERKTCALPDSFSTYSHTCDGIQHGAGCTISCAAGYSGSSTEQVCSDGSLLGDLPSCTPDSCSFAGMNIPTAIDVSPCVGAVSGQTCDVQCQRRERNALKSGTPWSSIKKDEDTSLVPFLFWSDHDPCHVSFTVM